MKLTHKLCLLFFAVAIGCKNDKVLHIYLENGSSTQNELPVEVYVDGVRNRTVSVVKGTNLPRSKHVAIPFPELKDSCKLKFRIANTGEETECIIHRDSLTSEKWVSVILHEMLLRKGWDIGGRVLTKDSVAEHSFGCGLESTPICGSIDN